MKHSRPTAFALVLLACLSACTHKLTVHAPVTLPARAPVFVFPSVWVAGGDSEEEAYLLDRIAAHLAREPLREVRRVEDADLEPAREAGQISWLTAVVRLKLSFRTDRRHYQQVMPVQYCGMWGCGMMSYQSYYSVVPVLVGEAVLTVYEGPTARVLSRETITRSAEGGSDEQATADVTMSLSKALVDAVDISVGQKSFTLQESRIEEADRGMLLLSRGQWREARAVLEAARDLLAGSKDKQKARVLHALGVARLLSNMPAPPTDKDFSAAQSVLQEAYDLVPNSLHRNTLEQVATWKEQQKVLAQQVQAEQHNFKLVEPAKLGAPPAPPAPPSSVPQAPPAPPSSVPSESP